VTGATDSEAIRCTIAENTLSAVTKMSARVGHSRLSSSPARVRSRSLRVRRNLSGVGGLFMAGAGYRFGRERGSPNHGSTLASKRVMARMRRPARVSTQKPVAWPMPAGPRR
jgi:hypothetical protein